MKIFLAAALAALIHGSYATLNIKGPNDTTLLDVGTTLECWYSDSDLNISQVHFEQYTTHWRQVKPTSHGCSINRVHYVLIEEHLFLVIKGHLLAIHYRCVSDAENVAMADKYSETVTLKLHYLENMSLSRESNNSYLSVPQELKVQAGEDLVVHCSANSSVAPNYYWTKDYDDLAPPSSTLSLRKITAADGGKYTCKAQHPLEIYLFKQRSFLLTVLALQTGSSEEHVNAPLEPEDTPWYETSNGRLVLMTSAAAGSLLVFILSVSVFLCRRAKQAKTSKGPIDDRSQKKPIYKASVESLPSTCADKQPLV